jgi:hypothetical protein
LPAVVGRRSLRLEPLWRDIRAIIAQFRQV